MSQTSAASSMSNQRIDEFEQFYRNYCENCVLELAETYPSTRSLEISWSDLFKSEADLADEYLVKPDEIRESAETALQRYPIPVDQDLSGAEVRISDLHDNRVMDISDLRADHINELVGIRGVVHKATQIKPSPVELAFECQRCGAYSHIPQGDSLQEPHECNGCERQGPFKIDVGESEYIDSRLIRLQVPPDRAQGQTDDQIDIWLERDLCDQVAPGDRVVIPSVLRIDSNDDDKKQYDYYGDARSVSVLETDFEDVDVTQSDVERIREVAEDGDPFSTLVNSFAPGIYGYESIKEAIMLQLFGGVTKPLPGGGTQRGHSHIALIGDPSTGKSTMLKYASDIAPRSVFTSGKGSSSAGLTASAVRDDFGPGDEWSLEGGAIVKADKGLACVDELDDMAAEDRSAMHEALSDMTVSVSKAGINATLNARTTLLAAMNPSEGRFSEKVPVGEQIELDPALLSRFDLIFTFTDEINEEQDRKVAMHQIRASQAGAREKNANFDSADPSDDVAPDLSAEFLRKYIAHAKQHYNPVLSDAAGEAAADELIELRQANETDDEDAAIPVTIRELGALIRLAEASARVRLSDTVEVSDVNRAARLAKQSLKDVGMDPESGELDADIIETGVSQTMRERRKQMQALLKEEQKEYDNAGMPKDEYIELLTETAGFRHDMVEKDIEQHYKQKGHMYEPRDGRIAWYD